MSQIVKRNATAIAAFLVVSICACWMGHSVRVARAERNIVNAALSLISREKAKNIVYFLASPELKGRKFGTPEGKNAAVFIREQLLEAGFKNYASTNRVYWQHLCKQFTPAEITCGRNIVAFIEGKTKKDEYVFVTAHYDHLGEENGQIYPGADDNASGTAVVMEVASAFAALAQKGFRPARNIVFVLFDGEEEGLIGSWYFVDHSLLPTSAIVAVFNVDMVGRNNEHELNVVASPDVLDAPITNPDLYRISSRAARKMGLQLLLAESDKKAHSFDRSDHAAFFFSSQANYRTPAVHYQDGYHPDYHKPSDTADKINYEKIERVARFVFLVAFETANASRRPVYKQEKFVSRITRAAQRLLGH